MAGAAATAAAAKHTKLICRSKTAEISNSILIWDDIFELFISTDSAI